MIIDDNKLKERHPESQQQDNPKKRTGILKIASIIPVIILIIAACFYFYHDSTTVDTTHKEKLRTYDKAILANLREIKELKKAHNRHYNQVMYSIAVLKSNQSNMIKQIDRITSKYYAYMKKNPKDNVI